MMLPPPRSTTTDTTFPSKTLFPSMAFRMRVTAEQYLLTCYSYLPNVPHVGSIPALYGADELWRYDDSYPGIQIARSGQGIVKPILDRWSGYTSESLSTATTGSIEGRVTTGSLCRGISDCNIFMENIDMAIGRAHV